MRNLLYHLNKNRCTQCSQTGMAAKMPREVPEADVAATRGLDLRLAIKIDLKLRIKGIKIEAVVEAEPTVLKLEVDTKDRISNQIKPILRLKSMKKLNSKLLANIIQEVACGVEVVVRGLEAIVKAVLVVIGMVGVAVIAKVVVEGAAPERLATTSRRKSNNIIRLKLKMRRY